MRKTIYCSTASLDTEGNRSTELASSLFLDDIRKEIDKGNLVGVVYMDLSKAFDTVAHSILLEKMTAYGINSMELEWFTSYLFQRKQQVVLNIVRSETHYVKCGVPQRSILGPLLFLIFFNDFSEILTNAKTILMIL